MRPKVWASLLLAAAIVSGAALSQPGDATGPGGPANGPAGVVELPHAWSGDEAFTSEAFEADGDWEILLGAWCHEGVSFVRVAVYTLNGTYVGELMLRGWGTRSVVMETGPGTFYLEVTSPDMDQYYWELLVRPRGAL